MALDDPCHDKPDQGAGQSCIKGDSNHRGDVATLQKDLGSALTRE